MPSKLFSMKFDLITYVKSLYFAYPTRHLVSSKGQFLVLRQEDEKCVGGDHVSFLDLVVLFQFGYLHGGFGVIERVELVVVLCAHEDCYPTVVAGKFRAFCEDLVELFLHVTSEGMRDFESVVLELE